MCLWEWVCVRVCVCVCTCVCVCVRECICVSMRECVCVCIPSSLQATYLQRVEQDEDVTHDYGEGHQHTTQPGQAQDGQQHQHCFHCSPTHTHTHTHRHLQNVIIHSLLPFPHQSGTIKRKLKSTVHVTRSFLPVLHSGMKGLALAAILCAK